MDKRHNEFKVTGKIVKGKFVIDRKEKTERGHVVISERDADTNNRQTRFTKLYYELAEEPKSEERLRLESEAKELGVSFRSNIGDDKLLEKMNEAKK